MASDSERIITLEGQVRKLLATVAAFQGQPADATLSVPHNDSWIFEDNVDATHPANLRYVISTNITRVVSARLSIFMAAYRTYNNFSATTTLGTSNNHNHGHGHTIHVTSNIGGAATLGWGGNGFGFNDNFSATGDTSQIVNSNAVGQSADHTHLISITSTLGVTEGTVATGVMVAFDGVDQTAALGGPFNADAIELDVRRFIGTAQGVKHTIAMQPSGNGRIEAHLRLGVYVSAAQVL